MKRAVITVAAVAVLVGATEGWASLVPVNSNSIVQNEIEYYMQTDKTVYDLGQDVEMLYRVTNLTDEAVIIGTVVADYRAYYDFRVMQGDNRIWEYPYLSIVLAFGGYQLNPLESKEFQTTWNMTNDNGAPGPIDDDFPIGPGLYNIIGELDLLHGGERVPVSVAIEVIPEPASILLLGLGGLFLLRQRTYSK